MQSCLLLSPLLAILFALAAHVDAYSGGANTTASICQTLAKAFPGEVDFQGTSNYTIETTAYWSFRDYLQPYCVFAPCTPQSLAQGVKILADSNTSFAVRSGGHSPIAGVANINNGVLIVTTHFDERTVVPAPNALGAPYVRIGANWRWGEIYDWLNPQGLNVVGGREWSVGTSAVLGGGVSYLSYRHGWASDNVLNYELVTGQGHVLQVNQLTYPDLYWAIKGASNNFGIITRYDMKTYPQGPVWGGTVSYAANGIHDFLDTYQAWINPGGGVEDIDAAIMPNFNYNPITNQTIATAVMVHNTPEDNPRAFQNFTKTAKIQNVGLMNYSDVVDQSNFYNGTVGRGNWFATAISIYNETLNYQYETLLSTSRDLLSGLNVSVGIASEPITTSFLQNSVHAGGDAMALDPSRGSFHIVLCYAFWLDPSLDDTMERFLRTLISRLDEGSKRIGKYYPFIWLNNAGDSQDPIALYGYGASKPKMQAISQKYDPGQVFQRLVPGFKLNGPLIAH